jgi:hypothetical protein
MNNKFLDKVIEQIISETRIIDGKVYTPSPFSPSYSLTYHTPSSFFSQPSSFLFSNHCKDVYSLKNEQEIDYVWGKYKEGITTLMEDKEPSHQEKG